MAVYANVASRTFVIPLQIPPDFSMKNGELHVVFLESGKDEKSGLIAKARLTL